MILAVCDWVLRDVEAFVGRHPPERGGALLGTPYRPLVSLFLPDPDAVAGPHSFAPSRGLARRVKEVEASDDLELKGILHSHPSGHDEPSARDAQELAAGLRVNPHLPFYLAPIVTPEPVGDGRPEHVLPLGAGRASFFAALRARSGAARVRPVAVRLVPLLGDLERAGLELRGGPPEVFLSDREGLPAPAGRLVLEGGLELLVIATEQYPAFPPIVIATPDGGEPEQLQLEWPLELPAEERLIASLRPTFRPPGPYRLAFGPRGGPALTRDEARAAIAGWPRCFAGDVLEGAVASRREALRARTGGLLSAVLGERSALVAGCGSIGSYVAEELVRSGLGSVALLDPDVVEAVNLSRTVYEAEDVGRAKTEALARRLLRIDPAVELDLHATRVDALAPPALDTIVRGCDLVVAATDDPAAQRALDRFAYARGKPALFIGVYAGAQGGEVLVTVPERTPCYLCATTARHRAELLAGRVERELDYGTARLPGEVALGADIHHVGSAAVKLALALLMPPGSDARLRSFVEEVVAGGAPYLTLSTVPRYWFYPRLFEGVPGQGAYQSVWLTPERDEECPVCGLAGNRIDPLDVPARTPRRTAFTRDEGEPAPG